MSELKVHPEELLDLAALGELSAGDVKALNEHCAECAACQAQVFALTDFGSEDLAQPGDDALIAELARAATEVSAIRSSRARPRFFSLAFAAAVLLGLMAVGGVAALWMNSQPANEPVPRRQPQQALPPQSEVESVVPLDEDTDNDVPDESVQEEASREEASRPRRRPRQPVEAPAPVVTAADLFRNAQNARRERRLSDAVDLFRQLQREFASSRQARQSWISCGRMMLDEMRTPQPALMQFNTYLTRFPNGSQAHVALFGRAEAQQRLGQRNAERDTWREVIRRFPDETTPANRRAQRRLRELR